MTPGQVLVAALAAGVIGCFLLADVIPNWPWRQVDEHRGADEAYADELAQHRQVLSGEVIDVNGVPIVAVEPDEDEQPIGWAQQRRRFHDLIEQVQAGDTRILSVRYALEYPTQEYRTVVAENFGVQVAEVGPREADIRCRRLVLTDGRWVAQRWEQDELDLAGVS